MTAELSLAHEAQPRSLQAAATETLRLEPMFRSKRSHHNKISPTHQRGTSALSQRKPQASKEDCLWLRD